MISWFADISLQDRPAVGGKGGSLGELTQAGVEVPAGFVVRTEAFERFLGPMVKEVRASAAALDANDAAGIAQCSDALRARIESADMAGAEAAIAEAYARLAADGAPVAVRSSATNEDSADASFAGLQDTYLWVLGAKETLAAVRRCWASLYSTPALAYRRRHGMNEGEVAMAVVVQRMVDARSAGVMFTRSPLTGDRSVIAIEASWGLGSSVVGGEVTPDRFVIGKIKGEITQREISDKTIEHLPDPAGGVRTAEVPADRRNAPAVSDEELATLREYGLRIERHYGRPQDIEWAIDRQGKIAILQARPETIWSNKEARPVAAALDNPLGHLMRVFGGAPRSEA
ncbi:MAG: PEP/pyruvate-binding domain-containing protein [Hyphomonadaceae bacterium]|nr:PEP/pyruvate-binding domain-containing protein [Hyphomonadaceae bacterium]